MKTFPIESLVCEWNLQRAQGHLIANVCLERIRANSGLHSVEQGNLHIWTNNSSIGHLIRILTRTIQWWGKKRAILYFLMASKKYHTKNHKTSTFLKRIWHLLTRMKVWVDSIWMALVPNMMKVSSIPLEGSLKNLQPLRRKVNRERSDKTSTRSRRTLSIKSQLPWITWIPLIIQLISLPWSPQLRVYFPPISITSWIAIPTSDLSTPSIVSSTLNPWLMGITTAIKLLCMCPPIISHIGR